MVNETKYGATARRFRELGYNVLPAVRGEKHPGPFFRWYHWQERLITETEIANFEERFPEADPVIVTGFCEGEGKRAFYVVDVDNPDLLPWALEMFGNTPLRTLSGREGGGVHLYYREKSLAHKNVLGKLGPVDGIKEKTDKNGKPYFTTEIDFKASHGVVVLAGATHAKTGNLYKFAESVPEEITQEWIETNVPIIDFSIVDELVQRFYSSTRKGHIHGTVPSLVTVQDKSNFDGLVIQDGYGNEYTWESLIQQGQNRAICCPFCADQNPSAMFYYHGRDSAIQCFTSCDTQYRPVSDTIRLGQEFLEELLHHEGLGSVEHLHLPPVNGYAPPLPEHRIVINRYPMGWGKTYTARQEAEKYTSTHTNSQGKESTTRNVVAVGPTQALCAKLSEDFGVASYAEQAVREITLPGVAICLPSLCRLSLNALEDFILVIDEADQIFDMLHDSNIMKDPILKHRNTVEVWEHLSWLMQNAKKVILADAFGSERLVREVERLMKHNWKPSEVAIVSPPPDLKPLAGTTTVAVSSEWELLAGILSHAKAGAKGVVCCDTKTAVNTIAQALNYYCPDLRVWKVSSDTPKVQKENLRNATEYVLENYDWVIHNQAAGSGVSLEMQGWMSFLHSAAPPLTTGPMLRQLSGRLRYPLNKIRYAYVKGITRKNNTDYLEYLPTRAKIKGRESLCISRVHDGEVVSVNTHRRILESKGDSRWYKNTHSLNCMTWYYDTLVQEGTTLVEQPSVLDMNIPGIGKVGGSLWEDMRTKAFIQDRGEKWGAPSLSDSMVKRLCDVETDEEAAMVARYWIVNYWGLEGLCPELIEDYGRGYIRKKCELFNDVRLLAGNQGISVLKKSQKPAMVRGALVEAELSPRFQRAESVLRTLKLLNVDVLNLDPSSYRHSGLYTKEIFHGVLKVYNDYDMKNLLDLQTPPKSPKSLVQYTNRILRLLGLESKAAKRVVNAKTVRGYILDDKKLDFWLRATQRSYDKALGKEVPNVMDVDNNPTIFEKLGRDMESEISPGDRNLQMLLVEKILEFRRKKGPFQPLPLSLEEEVAVARVPLNKLDMSDPDIEYVTWEARGHFDNHLRITEQLQSQILNPPSEDDDYETF